MTGIYKVNGRVIKIPIYKASETQIEFMKKYCELHGIEFSIDINSTCREIELDGKIITKERFAEILMKLEKDKIKKQENAVETIYNDFIKSIDWTVGPEEGEKYHGI